MLELRHHLRLLVVLLPVLLTTPPDLAGTGGSPPAFTEEAAAFVDLFLVYHRRQAEMERGRADFELDGRTFRFRARFPDETVRAAEVSFLDLPAMIEAAIDPECLRPFLKEEDDPALLETWRLFLISGVILECDAALSGAAGTREAWAKLRPRTADALLAALPGATHSGRFAMARCLPRMGNDRIARVLIERNRAGKGAYVQMICGMPGEVAAGFFRSIMAGEEPVSVKSAALSGVRFEPDDETFGRIVSILSPGSDSSDWLRSAARSALTRIGTPRARAALEKAFREAPESKKLLFVEALTRMGSGAGIPLLERRLQELRGRGRGDLEDRMRALGIERLEKLLAASRLLPVLVPVREKHDLPALAGAIVTSKGLLAVGATGVRRRGTEVKVTADDLWHIGSCTKSLTATLVGRLVEQRKLRWTTTLAEALPGLSEPMHAGYRRVTLADLLSHRAGAPRDFRAGGLWARLWKHPGPPAAARRVLAEGVLTAPPAVAPGTEHLYSNAGYAIAGHVAEMAAGRPYEDLMRELLFGPLGMDRAGFGAPGDPALIDQPHGHRPAGGSMKPVTPGPGADNPPAIAPAGTVHCSLADWARYVRLHLAGARDGEEKLLLTRETLREIQTPRPGQTYALGWAAAERSWGGGRVLTHAGSNTMWFAVAWLAPKRDFAVLVACNQGGDAAVEGTDEAASGLIRWFLARRKR